MRCQSCYDTILHDSSILRWLAERVSVERIVLGSDYSFPPADLDPLATVRAPGYSAGEIHAISEDNPRTLFPRPFADIGGAKEKAPGNCRS